MQIVWYVKCSCWELPMIQALPVQQWVAGTAIFRDVNPSISLGDLDTIDDDSDSATVDSAEHDDGGGGYDCGSANLVMTDPCCCWSRWDAAPVVLAVNLLSPVPFMREANA